jgi:hypothetical protein
VEATYLAVLIGVFLAIAALAAYVVARVSSSGD